MTRVLATEFFHKVQAHNLFVINGDATVAAIRIVTQPLFVSCCGAAIQVVTRNLVHCTIKKISTVLYTGK